MIIIDVFFFFAHTLKSPLSPLEGHPDPPLATINGTAIHPRDPMGAWWVSRLWRTGRRTMRHRQPSAGSSPESRTTQVRTHVRQIRIGRVVVRNAYEVCRRRKRKHFNPYGPRRRTKLTWTESRHEIDRRQPMRAHASVHTDRKRTRKNVIPPSTEKIIVDHNRTWRRKRRRETLEW